LIVAKVRQPETSAIYKRAGRRIELWAEHQNLVNVREIAADALDKWRGTWGENAVKRYNGIGGTSQSHFQGRLKQFCRWCIATGNLDRDPGVVKAFDG
jgi:hypothetical protein